MPRIKDEDDASSALDHLRLSSVEREFRRRVEEYKRETTGEAVSQCLNLVVCASF